MATFTRRVSSMLLAAAMVAGLAAEPAFAQVTPGTALNGPAGGVATTTAPSNSEGTPSGGSGTISSTRVGPSGMTRAAPSTYARSTSTSRARQRREARRRNARRSRGAVSSTGVGASTGLNGSNAISR